MGNSEPLELVILVTQSVTAAGAATVTFALETDDNAGFSSPVVLANSGAIGKAALTAGAEVLRVKVPLDAERYPRTNYTVATGRRLRAGLAPSRPRPSGQQGLRVRLHGELRGGIVMAKSGKNDKSAEYVI